MGGGKDGLLPESRLLCPPMTSVQGIVKKKLKDRNGSFAIGKKEEHKKKRDRGKRKDKG